MCVKKLKIFFFELNKFKSIKTNSKPGILHCLNNLNFNTKRIFYLDNFDELNNFKNEYLNIDTKNVKKIRGLHANINFDELLFLTEGEIEIKLIDKQLNESVKKITKNEYIFIQKMNWIEFEILKQETVIVVLANENLDNSISISNFREFLDY